MIFVTVGSSEQRFDRLLRSVESLSAGERLVVQHGASTIRPAGADCVDFLPFSDLLAHMREARVVITHAGVGSVLTALTLRKRPVVVPRRRRFGEAVDDHQVELARRLAGRDLVVLVEDPEDLPPLLSDLPEEAATARTPQAETALTRELRAYLSSRCR
jgi:UDP-N-acetylglucosamine transferase subunit ALG13